MCVYNYSNYILIWQVNPLMTGPSEQGQDERSLGGPSDPLDPQEAPSEAPQSHRVNPLSSQEKALAGSHPMGLMLTGSLVPPVTHSRAEEL
jgi:hypothetical protein